MSDIAAVIVLWAATIACFAAIILFAREPVDEPLGDDAYGDVPAIPGDLKISSFHSRKD